jgi:four helix bundle protein
LNENVKSIVDAFAEISDWLWDVTATTDTRAAYLCNQLMRAIDSVGANICEGFGRGYAGSLRQFYGYARGSALESAYWLDRAISRRLIPVESGVPMLQRLREHTTDIEGLIAVLPKGKT